LIPIILPSLLSIGSNDQNNKNRVVKKLRGFYM